MKFRNFFSTDILTVNGFWNLLIVLYIDVRTGLVATVANRPGMTGTIPERASLSRVPAKK